MAKSAVVKARIEPALKQQGDQILQALGLNATTAITLFYTEMVRQRGLPLALKVPNDSTLAAFDEAQYPENLTTYATAEQALNDVWE